MAIRAHCFQRLYRNEMDEKVLPKFVLPSPKFGKTNGSTASNHLYLTPSGMTLLPRSKQPPPMYGARGSTVPAKYLHQEQSSPVSVPASCTSPVYHSPPRAEFCHTCGMELANLQDMKRHLEQHEFCPADDCDFAALHNILERHIEANHITGTYVRVKKVWTEEELAAWRAERRKKFPTAANVELARLAKEQRIKRGERLEASKSRFGNREDRQRTRPNVDRKERFDKKNKTRRGAKGKANDKRKRVESANKTTDKANEASKQIETEEDRKNEEVTRCFLENGKFGGTGQMPDYQHLKGKVRQQNNALSSLLGMYGSDSDEESETESDEQDTGDCSKQVTAHVESSISMPYETTEKGPVLDDATAEASNTPISVENPQFCEDQPPTPTLDMTISEQVPPETNISQITPSASEPAKEDGSSDEAPDEEPFQRVTEAITAPASPKTEPVEPKPQTAPKRAAPKRIYGLNYKRARKQTPNTMLSKLLETDIRHERNVLLQCVRHVCEKNFFGIGQTKSNQETLDTTCDKSVDSTPDAL